MPCQHLIHTLSPFKSTSGRCTQLTESSTSKRWWRAPRWGCSHSSLSTDSHTVRGHQRSRELLWASFPEQGSTRSVGWITSGWTDQKWIVTQQQQQQWFLQLLKAKQSQPELTEQQGMEGRPTFLVLPSDWWQIHPFMWPQLPYAGASKHFFNLSTAHQQKETQGEQFLRHRTSGVPFWEQSSAWAQIASAAKEMGDIQHPYLHPW